MLDEKKAEVNVYGGGASEVETVKVEDINACEEEDDFGHFKIQYPYEITLVDSKGKVVLKEKTQKALFAKEWDKKFYVKTSNSGNDFPAFTRYMSLLALAEVKKAMTKEDLPPKLNLNNLVGFEFEAVVVRTDKMDPFIDWVGTFQHHQVRVPQVEDLMEDSTASSSFEGPKDKEEKPAEEKKASTPAKKGGAW